MTRGDFIRLHLVNKHFQANKTLQFDSLNLKPLPWRTPALIWKAHCEREKLYAKFYAKFYQAQKYKACVQAGNQSSTVIANSGEVYIAGRLGNSINKGENPNKFTLLCPPAGARIIATAMCDGPGLGELSDFYDRFLYAFYVLTDKGKVYAKKLIDVERLPLALSDWVDITPALPADDFVIAITAGHSSFLLVTAKGAVYLQGKNQGRHHMKWGLGFEKCEPVDNLTRVPLPPGVRATASAAGRNHFLILTDEGQVYAAGCNYHNQLGFKDTTSKNTFTLVPLPKGIHIMGIGAIDHFSYFLTTKGKVFSTSHWKLGPRDHYGVYPREELTPLPIEKGIYIVTMDIGKEHAILLSDTDQIYSVKHEIREPYHRLYVDHSSLPEGEIPIAIAAGEGHSLVLTQSNSILVRGSNYSGQLGLKNTGNNQESFTRVPKENFVR